MGLLNAFTAKRISFHRPFTTTEPLPSFCPRPSFLELLTGETSGLDIGKCLHENMLDKWGSKYQ